MITPVLLAGGSGTRLWPLSRKSYPKQFVPLIGETTPFQASAQRLSGKGYAPPLVLTNADFRFIVGEQLTAIGTDPAAILIEPEGRNTAPAVLAAALWLDRTGAADDALMLVAPSDHLVPDPDAFRAAVELGVPAAKAGKLVTFGIAPDHAETGYGYLELAEPHADTEPHLMDLVRFVEKPGTETAEAMVAGGRHLWNAGIFLFSVKAIVEAFVQHAPGLVEPVARAVAGGRPDLDFHRLDPESWAGAESISLDYAVMERADNLAVVPFAAGWSDLGGWDAIWRESPQDDTGVALGGNATAIDCRNSLLRSDDEGLEVVGLGLENIIAVAMKDAVLVADIDRAQDVKQVVTALKDKGAHQATAFPLDHRPWGWFESLVLAERFQVKRIVVKPGAALSLQSHHHRAEHWVVVSGTAEVTIDDKVQLVTENQSVYIPLGAKHRMANPGKMNMVLIEVQTGSYLGEDDIIRYEDVYARD
ncbi:MAG: mannose-1-phosphate guanylyltransferase/mannose-6-phosphate isomerase [Rhodobacterales bacterium]|nr:MAG: mannose-1-phosphate guanylyltransferase/mannose-6-phosphate isomerase [Rhodobacterales bacterium]